MSRHVIWCHVIWCHVIGMMKHWLMTYRFLFSYSASIWLKLLLYLFLKELVTKDTSSLQLYRLPKFLIYNILEYMVRLNNFCSAYLLGLVNNFFTLACSLSHLLLAYWLFSWIHSISMTLFFFLIFFYKHWDWFENLENKRGAVERAKMHAARALLGRDKSAMQRSVRRHSVVWFILDYSDN